METVVLAPPESPAKLGMLKASALRLMQVTFFVYLGVMLCACAMQNSFIFPGSATQGQPDAVIDTSIYYDVLNLRTHDGTHIAAIFGKALTPDGLERADAAQRPTVIYFYGNGACLAYCQDVFDHFRRMGMNVIIPDFEGYGMSAGNPSESGCYASADAVYDYLLTRPDIDRTKIVSVGWSLGAAVAIDLASRRPVAGLATFSAFTSMPDMAKRMAPWLPMSLICRTHFDNLAKIKTISCPILLAHGTRDKLIPSEMSDRLAAAAGSHAQRISIDGAGHNDVFIVGGESLFQQVDTFVESL